MANHKTDIVVLGATGFTGKLITRYLSLHPQHTQGLFTFSVAGRSQSKLHNLVQELSLSPRVNTIRVDVTNEVEVEDLVKSTRVVINTVGPYWRWGTPVVKACAKNGTHYVDLTGETVWVKSIVLQYDYLATKTGAIIVPSCGYDSIPSDISVFLSNKALKAYGQYDIGDSTTAFSMRGGISGGTLSTIMTSLEEVPRDQQTEAMTDYSISPVKGRTRPPFSFVYTLPIPGIRTINGGFFFMQPANKALVQRTFGLLEQRALSEGNTSSASMANRESYGPSFAYDEFVVIPSRVLAFALSATFVIGLKMLALIKPLRWLVKRFAPQPGEGPSDEYMETGFFETTNLTTSTSTPPVHVKSVMKGNGDPGYLLTAIMISESALSLILPPTSITSSSSWALSSGSNSLPEGLPDMARTGGILTPMTAFGDALVVRLSETGRFEFQSEVLSGESVQEVRKNI